MTKLSIDGKSCGCTFTLAGGFVYTCERHLAAQKARKAVTPATYDLLGAVENREPFVYRVQAPTTGGTPPPASKAFHKAIYKRTAALLAERKLCGAVPTRREREHMHKFAFTAEQVLAKLKR